MYKLLIDRCLIGIFLFRVDLGTMYALYTSMKTAISIFDKRIAPVFDTAREICLIDDTAENGSVRTFCRFEDDDLYAKVQWLAAQGIETLVCGAISRPMQMALTAAGIRVVSFICGDLEKVAEALPAGKLNEAVFVMPGCCGRRRGMGGEQGQGMGRGQGRGRGQGMGRGPGVGRGRGMN